MPGGKKKTGHKIFSIEEKARARAEAAKTLEEKRVKAAKRADERKERAPKNTESNTDRKKVQARAEAAKRLEEKAAKFAEERKERARAEAARRLEEKKEKAAKRAAERKGKAENDKAFAKAKPADNDKAFAKGMQENMNSVEWWRGQMKEQSTASNRISAVAMAQEMAQNPEMKERFDRMTADLIIPTQQLLNDPVYNQFLDKLWSDPAMAKDAMDGVMMMLGKSTGESGPGVNGGSGGNGDDEHTS